MSYAVWDVLKEQRKLTAYWETDEGRNFAMGLAEVARLRNLPISCPQIWLEATSMADSTRLAADLAHRTRVATAFWTSRDMVALTQTASLSRPPGPIYNDNLPQSSGFALFDKPAYFDMSRAGADPYLVNVTGFSWHQARSQGRPGVDVIMYSEKSDREDGLLTSLRRAHRYSPWKRTPPLLIVASFFMPYGEEYLDDIFAHFCATWWHLISQPLAVQERQKAPRPMQKMLGKFRLNDTVSIVNLRSRPPRKQTDQEGEGRLVDWQNRWIVHGFWRNQYYPSKGRHERIYIHDFIKGPEDKPLIVRTKVYAWRR